MTADTQLDTLEAKGLIKEVLAQPEHEYLFRHALVQDAAYGSLLKQERRELHGRVGEALEALYPERTGELAPVLAMHFEQAGDAEKATTYFIAAGEHALGQNAIQEAFGAFDHAATLMDRASMDASANEPADPTEARDRQRRRIEVELGRAQAGYSFMAADDAFAKLEAIVPAAEALGEPALITRVHTFIALGRIQAGESAASPLVKRSLDRLTEIGDAVGDPSIRALPMALVGMGQVFSGPLADGVRALEEAVPLLGDRIDSIGAAFARGALGIGYATQGEFAKADEAVRHAIETAANGDLIAQLDALIADSMVRSARGDLEGAVPLAQQCVDRAEETGASACILASSWILGDAFHRQGRFAEARDALKRGSDVSVVVDRMVWRPTLQAWLRSSAQALGDAAEGDADEALATARSIGNQLGEAGILGKRGESAAARGEFDSAVTDFAGSAAIFEAQGARPALARVLRGWGEALRAAGRMDEATPILQRSLALFETLDLKTEAAAVRAVLTLGGLKLAYE
ncbi:MAG: tetratricopeptide repeat protein [Chloroflexi bacterium]|nr:tetratricopeptide repeat protein [Chloroflexota bacterium]